MNPLLRKEIRLLLPAWCVALLLAVVPPLLIEHERYVSSSFWIAAFGVLILAVSTFGRESALGTFSSMLAEPVPRRRIFGVKVILLTVALLSVLSAFFLAYLVEVGRILSHPNWMSWLPGKLAEEREALRQERWQVLESGIIWMAAIFAGGLWTTLVFRQMVAAFWVTILVPGCLAMGTTLLGAALGIENTTPMLVCALIVYSFAGMVCSFRLFQRTEDTPFIWSSKFLPSLSELAGMKRDVGRRGVRNASTTLLRQEFSLHQVSLIGAGMLLLLNLGSIGVRVSGMLSRESDIYQMLEMTGMFWFLVPLMLGASAIAEERRLGTLEARLCLPVSQRRQYLLKLTVAVILGVLLGAVMFWLTELVAQELGLGGVMDFKGSRNAEILPMFAVSVGLTLIGYYASSLSHSSLQALGTAIAVGLVGVLSIQASVTGDWREFNSTAWIPAALWASLFLVMMGLAYRNFSHLHCSVRRVMRNVSVLVLSLTAVTTLCAGIYWRAWEFLGPLEPEHGAPMISGAGKTTMVTINRGPRLLILFPDGRLWKSGEPRSRFVNGVGSFRVPTAGRFLGESNWTALVASSLQAIALRSDGTLWSICRYAATAGPSRPIEDQTRQIGADTNWLAVAAGWMHMLAVKDDGTLWGWDLNDEGQLTGNQRIWIEEPVQISEDSDWVKVFGGYKSTVGVKADNTWWRWGRIEEMAASGDFVRTNYTEPVRWEVEFDPAEVKELVSGLGSSLILREDNALWVVGQLYAGMFGSPGNFYASEPVQVGQNYLWADVDYAPYQTGVTLDGNLWMHEQVNQGVEMIRVSRYSDWIAVSGDFQGKLTALAADGTVSCWPVWRSDGRLKAPRGPLTSFNIFDEPQ